MKTSQALVDVTHPDKWVIHLRHYDDRGVRKSAVEMEVHPRDRSCLFGDDGPTRPVTPVGGRPIRRHGGKRRSCSTGRTEG